MVKVRVVIADDQTLFRSGLWKLLESKPNLKVAGEAASGLEAVALVEKLKPDILLLNPHVPNLSGLELLRQLVSSPLTRVILLTAKAEANELVQAFRLNARGIVLKGAATQSIFSSIDAVMSGQYWIYGSAVSDPERALTRLSEPVRAETFRPRQFDLTQRELDVVKAVAAGCTNRQIAVRLSISEQTVKHHITNIFNKTGASNRLELTLFAIKRKLIEVTLRKSAI
jgi:two-component system nitrate/nitrite response regulator NarL